MADPLPQDRLQRSVAASVRRRQVAERERGQEVNLWYGLGFIGMVGWSLVLPMFLLTEMGRWLDRHYPGGFSWTLTLMLCGLGAGIWNIWRWVVQHGVIKEPPRHE